MIRILFHLRGISFAGTEVAVYNLISYLSKLGKYEITIGHENPEYSQLMFNKLSKYATVKYITGPVDTDVLIYCFYDRTEVDVEVLDQVTRKKTIFWQHFFGKNCILQNEKFCADLEHIVCVSEAAKNFFIEYEPMAPKFREIIEVLPNVVPVEQIQQKAKEACPVPLSEELTLVTIARLNPGKGYDKMLKMVKILEKRKITYTWYIIGEEYNNDEVRNGIIEMFRPYTHVKFLGEMANPYTVLGNSDYLVLLSKSETYGLVVAEAKILGIPCILTNFQTASDFIEDGVNGIILDKDVDSEYEEKLKDIVLEKERYKKEAKSFKLDNGPIIRRWEQLLEIK